MNLQTVLFVIVAHHDDWPLFMGKDVFVHLRDRDCRVVVVVTTAGDAGIDAYHWQSRLAGNLFALMRGLQSLDPYATSDLPLPISIAYAPLDVASKRALRAGISQGETERAAVYCLHLPDGGSGAGFPPRHQSLAKLYRGEAAETLWPADDPSTYRSWAEFEAAIECIIERERRPTQARILLHAASLDEQENPGDHSDHRHTSLAVEALAARDPSLHVTWFCTYALAAREENLDDAERSDQRAAIHAYGAGYTAAAAGLSEVWRTGWQREYEAFKHRQYPRFDSEITTTDPSRYNE